MLTGRRFSYPPTVEDVPAEELSLEIEGPGEVHRSKAPDPRELLERPGPGDIIRRQDAPRGEPLPGERELSHHRAV